MKIDAEQRRLARERNHYLWHLKLDGGTRHPPEGIVEICGPIPPHRYEQLLALVQEWLRKGEV